LTCAYTLWYDLYVIFYKEGRMIHMVKVITAAEFEAEVLQSSTPVLLDFYAPWCGPCNAMSPILDELAVDFEGKAKILKVNTDDNKELAVKYGVRGIPNIMFFKSGEVVDGSVGRVEKSELEGKLNAIL